MGQGLRAFLGDRWTEEKEVRVRCGMGPGL